MKYTKMKKLDLIIEKIMSVLKEDKDDSLLFEMAYHRKEFVSKIEDKTTEIVRNFALIYYATHYNDKQSILNHWRGELITLITDFQDMDTKPRRGNRDMVKKAVLEVWNNKMELNRHPMTVVHKFIAKFKDENINLSNIDMIKIANAFISISDNLANEMAYGNYDSTFDLINNI